MTWRTTPPDGRVFALVLPRGSRIPFVGQYDRGTWYGESTPSQQTCPANAAEWHPLPPHPAFNTATHALPPPPPPPRRSHSDECYCRSCLAGEM